MFLQGSVCGIVLQTRQCIHWPMSTFLHAQQCDVKDWHQCMQQGSALPSILHCFFMLLGQCMHRASIGIPVQSAVFCCQRACGWLPPVCCSAPLRLSLVPGLLAPHPWLHHSWCSPLVCDVWLGCHGYLLATVGLNLFRLPSNVLGTSSPAHL